MQKRRNLGCSFALDLIVFASGFDSCLTNSEVSFKGKLIAFEPVLRAVLVAYKPTMARWVEVILLSHCVWYLSTVLGNLCQES